MPWAKGDVDKHKKGLSKKQKELWLKVANPARKACLDKIKGTPTDEQVSACEGSAIRQANAVAGGQMKEVRISESIPVHGIYLSEKEGKRWRLRLIDEGMSGNRHMYTGEVLREAVNLFEGVPCFTDHPTSDEESARPERSIRDKVGVFENPVWEADGIEADFIPIDPWLREVMLTSFNEGVPDFVQFSINATGLAESETDRHGKYDNITEMLAVQSVDAVTQGAAGGRVLELLASQRDAEEKEEMDWKDLTIKELAENRSDLLETIRKEEKAKAYGEKAELLESRKAMQELEETHKNRVDELETDNQTLQDKVESLTIDKRATEAANVVAKAVNEAELPSAAQRKLVKLFEVTMDAFARDDSEDAREKLERTIKEAIDTEKEYLAELIKQPEITGMGTSEGGITSEKAKAKLTEAFMRLGETEEDAKRMAEVRCG